MDSLYVEIFQYIQPFLKAQEYAKLMNTNNAILREIRKETIIFHIKSRNQISSPTYFLLKDRVKNPQKQIYITVNSILKTEIPMISSISLCKISLDTEFITFSNTFDFSMFNNIPIVRLKGFLGVSRISNGLQNIQDLVLRLPSLQTIYDFNVTGSLRKFNLHGNGYIRLLPPQKEINELFSILYDSRLHLPFDQHYSVTFEKLGKKPLDLTRLFIDHLQYLYLTISDFECSPQRIDALALVPSLHLSHDYRREPKVVDIPKFLGEKLTLDGLNLTLSWMKSPLYYPHLESLVLERCTIPAELPPFPCLKRLRLNRINQVQKIPSFPGLIELILCDLPSLTVIERQPRLANMSITMCSNLVDLSPFEGQIFQSVRVISCEKIEDISPLHNSYSFQISGLSSLQKFDGEQKISLASSSLHCHWVISGLNRQSDEFNNFREIFSNIYDLQISNIDFNFMKKLYFDEDTFDLTEVDVEFPLSNICRLGISHCDQIKSTAKMFSYIKESLIIDSCDALESLKDLQNIPKICLSELKSVKDISGLGNHDHVYIYHMPFLEQAARDYLVDKQAGKANNNPHHDIFDTIKGLTILNEKEDTYNMFFSSAGILNWNSYHLFQHDRLW